MPYDAAAMLAADPEGGDEAPPQADGDSLTECAREVLDALHSKNTEHFAEALKAFIEMC